MRPKWRVRPRTKGRIITNALYFGLPKRVTAIEAMGFYTQATAIAKENRGAAIELLVEAQKNLDNILDTYEVKHNPEALRQYTELRKNLTDYLNELQS